MENEEDLYVFLDFDGVLNSHDWYARRPELPEVHTRDEFSCWQIDPEAVKRVNVLCERTGAQVVISSTWRGNMSRCLRVLMGLRTFEIVGHTPHLDTRRGHEIQKWMDENDVKAHQIVILDDDSDMEHLLPRLVKTPYSTGFTDEHVEQAVKLLKGGK